MDIGAHSSKNTVERLYLAIAVTDMCNYRCGYCHPFGESKVTHGQNLSQIELEGIIDAAHDSGFRTFRFTGGECTLVPWFEDVLTHTLKKPNTRANICTNGSTLDAHIDLFEKYRGNASLRISLDSTSEDCRKLGFQKILTPKLASSLKELSAKKIPTRFNTVVTQQNKSNVPEIIAFAQELGFDVKLLDLYTQDEYISTTDGKTTPEAYWKENYIDLSSFANEFERTADSKIRRYNVDGGYGIPMYAFNVDGIRVIFKDSTQGSFYHKQKCIQDCKYFKTACQEGVYTPHISSNAVLHINGCHNSILQWDLRTKTHKQKVDAFGEIISLFSDLAYVPVPPQTIKALMAIA